MRKAHDGFHQHPRSLLNVLTHGVQVGGELDGGGEDADAVLALALAVELLPPLGHEPEARLVACENFDGVALRIELLARGSVLPCGIFGRAQVERTQLRDGGVYDALHIDAGDGHRQ